MKDWVSLRSAGSRPSVRVAGRRQESSRNAGRQSRFLLRPGRQLPQAFVSWQHRVAQVPALLVLPPASSQQSPAPEAACERVLDAPGLSRDPLTSLMAWSANSLAVGLCCFAYCWRVGSGEVAAVYGGEDPVRALGWHSNGVCLAVSTALSEVALVDACKGVTAREVSMGLGGVNSLTFNRDLLCAADCEGALTYLDIRMKRCVMRVDRAHQGSACRLDWNSDLTQLASGGADGVVRVWEMRQYGCLRTLEAESCVRGLAWHPSRRGWLAYAGDQVRLTDLCGGGEQMLGASSAGLGWSGDLLVGAAGRELREARGARRLAQLESAVLQLAVSNSGLVVTASEDETLRFWQVPICNQ